MREFDPEIWETIGKYFPLETEYLKVTYDSSDVIDIV